MSLATESISSLRAKLTAGEITSEQILDDLIQSIEANNPQVGAYISWDIETARKAAREADLSLPLGGIPIAIKDNINTLDEPCTCASKFLDGAYTSPYDATVITKLKAAGAIPFGRANMDEFAMGSTCDNSALQQTNNPHDFDRVAGGSSGGSAAAVGSHTAIAAVGSDKHGASDPTGAAFWDDKGVVVSGRDGMLHRPHQRASLDPIGGVSGFGEHRVAAHGKRIAIWTRNHQHRPFKSAVTGFNLIILTASKPLIPFME